MSWQVLAKLGKVSKYLYPSNGSNPPPAKINTTFAFIFIASVTLQALTQLNQKTSCRTACLSMEINLGAFYTRRMERRKSIKKRRKRRESKKTTNTPRFALVYSAQGTPSLRISPEGLRRTSGSKTRFLVMSFSRLGKRGFTTWMSES